MGAVAHGAIGAHVSAVLLGLLSMWIVLQLGGVRHRFPWQFVDLERQRPPSPSLSGSARKDAGVIRRSSAPAGRRGRIRSASAPAGSRHARQGRRDRQAQRAVESDLPAAVDLLHVAVSAGHSLHGAVAAVARSGNGPVSEAFADVDQRFRHGGALVDELERLPARLGPSVRPLSTTLVVAASSGAPLGPTLQRLADAERRRLRRRTEERVRRLPVLLLAPLVGLVLPAFVLLTVVPVALTTARTGLVPLGDPSALHADPSAPGSWRSPASSPAADTLRSPP